MGPQHHKHSLALTKTSEEGMPSFLVCAFVLGKEKSLFRTEEGFLDPLTQTFALSLSKGERIPAVEAYTSSMNRCWIALPSPFSGRM